MEKQKVAAIYVRCSTSEQDTQVQETELKEFAEKRRWVINNVYKDKGVSGAKENRPALDELLADARRRKMDVVLVWKFDRFARSLKQLIGALEFFRRLRIDFVSYTEGIDTSIPSGELVFHIFGAMAQFERALISERVKAGLAQARRAGTRLGRPPIRRLTEPEAYLIRADWGSKECSIRGLAARYGTTEWMIRKAISVGETSA